jgi:hypothetical protein
MSNAYRHGAPYSLYGSQRDVDVEIGSLSADRFDGTAESHQQALGLNRNGVPGHKMQENSMIAELSNISRPWHEQKCCAMTNFDGIRRRKSPSRISISRRSELMQGWNSCQ